MWPEIIVFIVILSIILLFRNYGTIGLSGLKMPNFGNLSLGPWFIKWKNGLDEPGSHGARVIVLITAILFGYLEFHITGTRGADGALHDGTAWSSLIILLIAAIYKPPKSKIVFVLLTLDLAVVILSMFFPGFASMRHTSYDIANTWSIKQAEKMAKFEDTYKSDVKDKGVPEVALAAPVSPPQVQVQTLPPKKIALGFEWSEAVFPPISGGRMMWVCTKGGEVMVRYDKVEGSLGAGQRTGYCPMPGELATDAYLGRMFVNARYFFRSEAGGYAIVENGI